MHPRSTWLVRAAKLRAAVLAVLALAQLSSCARLPDAPIARDRAAADRLVAMTTPLASAPTDVIVRFRPGVSGESVAAAYGSVVLGSIPELNVQLLRTPAESTSDAFIHKLVADERVIFAEPNDPVANPEARQSTYSFSEATRTWSDVADQTALLRIGAPQAQALARGEGVLVAILDTGIDLDHPALANVVSLPGIEPGVTTSPGADRPEGVDTNGDGVVDGALGHGTHVAGIVHAVAPAARLLAVRVLDSDGVGDAFRVARGLVLAVGRGAAVANLSLGMLQPSRSVQAAIDYATAAGVVVVAAAGNADSSEPDFPAAYAPVLAVAGTDSSDRKAGFSNFGAAVDLAAPSVGILSTFWDGTFARWSGTSMAAPFASGVAALGYGALGARSSDSAQKLQSVMEAGATPLVAIDPTYGALLGTGRVDAAAALRILMASFTAGEPDLYPALPRVH